MNKKLDLHIIMPMAGEGKRFKDAGYNISKPLIEIDNSTIYEKAIFSLDYFRTDDKRNINYTFIVREDFKKDNIEDRIHKSFNNANIIYVDKTTNGALETSYLAKPYIKDDEGVILMDCDVYFSSITYINEIKKQLSKRIENVNPCLLTFENDNPRYSYVKLDKKGFASEVVEKKVISNNAILGCYFVGTGHLFKNIAATVIERWYDKKIDSKEIYTSLLFNEYILHRKVEVVKINHCSGEYYVSMGTPEEFEEAKLIYENGKNI
ncbi:MAG: hypothetical protein IKO36_12180 [Bacteroidaceae bacterium]|nr:hypothetical protein [Bacteroidaceae bacterium]